MSICLDGTLEPLLVVLLYEHAPDEPHSFWTNDRQGSCVKQMVHHMVGYQQKRENKKNCLVAVSHNGELLSSSMVARRLHVSSCLEGLASTTYIC